MLILIKRFKPFKRIKETTLNLVALFAIPFLSVSAQGQNLGDCRLIDSDVDRLLCYDKLPSGIPIPNGLTREITIATFKGSGVQSTRPFVASSPWRIQWVVDGKSMLIYIHNADEKIVGKYDVGEGSSSGRIYWPNSGIFSLEIITTSRWQIEINGVP